MIKKISKTKHSEAPVKSDNEFPVVGIGASAGGLEAFKKLLKAIPEESGMAYVLVQHLDPTHASLLPELLQKVTQIPVLEISDDIKVEPNHIYVIPSNKMMVATDGVLLLTPRPASTKNNRNLPIDLFFNSLAEVHQAHAIGVVLSGTASDGTAGLRAIKDYGGLTFAQDDKSAAYDSMPNSAVHAGVVDFVLPPEQIPAKILEVHKSISKIGGNETSFPRGQEEVFKQIISQLRIRKGTDFTYYKPNTIQRRILRRMVLNKNSDPAEYLKFLKDNKPEQDILYQDMLIPVTAFFRDPKVFENLTESVLPQIIKNKGDNDPIRVWVAGCSTGEEAYSIAICLNEFLGERTDKIQIFATDISEPAITKARSGVYSNADIINISPARLNEFFIKSSTGYTLKKSVRDSCVFALHNFIKDPPFGKMDLITCRNVLIYMQPYLQKKALTTFHYSLKPKGFLLLGKTESVNAVPEFFATIDKSDKIFSNKVTMGRNMMEVSSHAEQKLSPADPVVNQEVLRTDFQKTADDLMLSKYTPAGVVVDQALDIVHFRGNTANYLEQSSGKPSHNILKMAKNALAFDLRNILHKLKKENTTVIKENIPLEFSGSIHQITIEGMPLSNTVEPYYLILFHDNTLGIPLPASAARKKKTKELLVKDAKDLRIEQLEQELSRTREDVMSIAEDQESTNEELQSDNEELMSSSEELQSLNEELETSKEELQSTNEELTVVNQEIISLNEQVTEARDYAEAIVDTVGEPLLVIDKRLRIKTANSAFYQTFRTLETETEGKYIFEMDEGQWDIPELRNALEKILKEKSVIKDLEITYKLKKTGERYLLLNARQLNITSNSEELILLAIQDITISKKVQEQQRQIEKRFQFIADAMPQKVWTADHDGNYNYFNKNWLDYTGLSFEEMKDKVWKKLIHPDDWEEHKKQWQHSIDTGKDFEVEHRFLDKDGKYHWHLSRSLAYKDKNGKIVMWVGTNTGIEEQKKRKEELEKAVVKRTYELLVANESLEDKNIEFEKINSELQAFAYVSSHDLQEPLRKIQTFANRILETENDRLSDKGKSQFAIIHAEAARMQQLIEDLLAFSQINASERKFETSNLREIMLQVISQLSETIAEKKAIIDTTGLGEGKVVSFQFHQLMYNLLGNALKFSSPDRPLAVIVKSRIITGSKLIAENISPVPEKILSQKIYCHISFADNGMGFAPQFNELIFQVFQRLNGKLEFKGTGIGLAIAKKIVENHNGIITATGEVNKGAVFNIYIPDNITK